MNALDLALEHNASVISAPLLGHLKTLDGYNRTVTVSGSPLWLRSENRVAFSPQYTGRYAIAHGSEQLFTDQTIFIHFSQGIQPEYQYFVVKYDGVAAWLLIMDFTFKIRFYNSTLSTYKRPDADPVGSTSLGVTSVGSSTVDFFYDGTFVEQETGLDFSSQPSVPIYVGNTFVGSSIPCLSAIDFLAIFPSALEHEIISGLHAAVDRTLVTSDPVVNDSEPQKDTKGAVTHLWGPPNENNVIPDYSGSGYHATLSGSMGVTSDADRHQYVSPAQGGALITIPKGSLNADKYQYTLEFKGFTYKGPGEASAGRVFSKGPLYVYANGYYVNFTGGFDIWGLSVPTNKKCHLQFSHDRSTPGITPELHINGAPASVSVAASSSGNPITDATFDLSIFNIPTAIRAADAETEEILYYPTILSSADKRDNYVKFATRHVIDLTPRFEHPETFGAVTAPGNVGPWRTWAGTHQWIDDGVDRYIETSTNNAYMSLQSKYNHGAWFLDWYKATGNVICIQILSNDPTAGYTGARQTGTYFISPTLIFASIGLTAVQPPSLRQPDWDGCLLVT